jgi:5,5'-dehydrodivanillate O-demethylase oxygenase subunit
MLSEATNRLLTEIGAGTRMGDYLRRYWHPIAAEHELQQPGTRACRVLGEDLVLYRDLSGNLGLLDRHCPHRRADLAHGYVETHGLRCNYHGWRFDAQGRCLEQPFEDMLNAGARVWDKAITRAYPVRAHAGLLWAYLGPAPPPLIPDWEPFSWKNGFVQVFFAEVPCNWLQCQENAIDPVHLEWMHLNWSVRQSGRTGPYSPRHLQIGFDETEYGFIYRRITEATSAQDDLWTLGRVTLWPNGFYAGDHFDWHTPIDDHTTLRVSWAFARVPHEKQPFEQPLPVPSWRSPVKDANGRWLELRPVNQDFVALVGQGPVADRTREHLATSDQGVILLRRRLLAELEGVARGEEPKGLLRDPAKNVRISLPCPNRQIYLEGLPLREMLAHPSVGAMIRSYPFQEGEPAAIRQAFTAALGLDEQSSPEEQRT